MYRRGIMHAQSCVLRSAYTERATQNESYIISHMILALNTTVQAVNDIPKSFPRVCSIASKPFRNSKYSHLSLMRQT